MMRYLTFLMVLWGVLFTAFSCNSIHDVQQDDAVTESQVEIDLPQIKERGKLIALTGYDMTSYFIYKGRPMGFEYELLKDFALYLGVDLEIVVVRDLDSLFVELNRGTGDLLAYNLTVTKERQEQVDFTDHHTEVRQVLVQRLPENWRKMTRDAITRALITSPIDLIGKKVHVRKGSAYYERLVNLSHEIGGEIDIVTVPGDVTTEELIRQVAAGEIDYTVADENIAWINQSAYDNLDVSMPLSLPQRIAWGVRKNSPHLRAAVNQWLTQIKREPTFNVIYHKYYRNRSFFRQRISSDFFSVTGRKISPFDHLIQKHAQKLAWDWRLLAALIYKESRFNPTAASWAGAQGLMQLVQTTADAYGANDIWDPQENLKAGTNYLIWLTRLWKEIPDSTERLKFILASYNVGPGHVIDARRLAEKYGKDPNSWRDVGEFLRKKSLPEFYNDEVVQSGYCRGDEPVNYVEDIFKIYRHYRRFIAG